MRTFHFQFIGIVMGLLLTIPLFSQSVGINDDGSQPNAAAILDIKSTNKGLLIPRTDTTTINTLGTPTNGLIIYQTTDDVFYYFDGSRWRGLSMSDERVFEKVGSLIRQKDDDDESFVFGKETLPENDVTVSDLFFFFDKDKAAFRGGELSSSKDWASDSLGLSSFAFGYNTKARGDYSVALGEATQAIGENSLAGGYQSIASRNHSLAFGYNTVASGRYSLAFGRSTESPSGYETVFGRYNTIYSPANYIGWNDEDRLFTIGNGSSSGDRSNALTILKNGNTTLKGELTLTDGTSPYTLPNTDGSADQVLSTDGAGIMSWTDRGDFGVFERDGTLIRQKGNVDTDDFIFGRDVLPANDEIIEDDKMFFFDQSKGAFRAGKLYYSRNWSPDSIGFYSFALGYNTKAKSYCSTAWGGATEAKSEYSTAWGYRTLAKGQYSTVWGNNNRAIGNETTAWGSETQATGDKSTAWGYVTHAKGYFSTAWGSSTRATGTNSTAWGSSTRATGDYSTAWGSWTVAPSYAETVLGRFNIDYTPNDSTSWNSDDRLFVIGNGTGNTDRSNALTMLKNGNTTLKGELTLTDGTSPYTLPNTDGSADQVLSTDGAGAMSWTDRDDFGVFERDGSLIRQKSNVDDDDFIFGRDALPQNGENVIENGFLFFDQFQAAFRVGSVNGDYCSPDSIGFGSFALGGNNKAKGYYAAAWGDNNQAIGNEATAWGSSTLAKGDYSTAWGYDTKAKGYYSTAWGYSTLAKGDYSTAWGDDTHAEGYYSTAWGYSTLAEGNYSTAWGYDTHAEGNEATAWGSSTLAKGTFSTAWGNNIRAESYLETVLGRYNTEYTPYSTFLWNENDRLFVIGNGAGPTARSNALTMLKNGNTTLKGELTLTDGTSPYTLPNTDGSADQVLSTDGAGIMSWTDRDDFGVFERDGNLIRQKGNVDTDDFIFGRDALPANGESVTETFFFFDQSKGAFRNGRLFGSKYWAPDSIGIYSFAHGFNTKAIGDNSTAWGSYTEATRINSTAWGSYTEATGDNSTAWGSYAEATGDYSTAWGGSSRATGDYSTAWGSWIVAGSAYETALGRYNTTYTPYSNTDWNDDDRLFVIGNGSLGARSNALTMLKNGNTTLKGELTLTDGTSPYTLPNTDGITDQVLSTDGAGAVSWVDGASFAVFERDGSLIKQKDNITTDDLIFGRDALPTNGESVTGKFLSFDKSKGSLRTGELNASSNWSPENSGKGSLAWGYNAKAKGDYSTAKGFESEAIGYSSSAWGFSTNANKKYSTAWGGTTIADGDYSTAWGKNTHAESHLETVLGQYNTDYTPNSTSLWNDNDRLFVIGSGTSTSNRKNALTVLKNGCIGLQNFNTPTYALHLPNSSSNDKGKGLAYAWTTYSDTRIKSQQVSLDYGLEQILQLTPKSYFQHHSDIVDERLVVDTENGKMDIGLIAQEVYDIIPEVVNKPEDENMELWSMNYEKLVPVLINAIQEQQQMIKQLEQSLIEEKEDRENANARLEKMEKILSNKNTMR